LGYPHELWTTRLLARHARAHGRAEGHACLGKLVQGTLCKILNEQEVKPHKVRYYLERRDPEFKAKMAEVLCVYPQVRIIRETARALAWRTPPAGSFFVAFSRRPHVGGRTGSDMSDPCDGWGFLRAAHVWSRS
jgi:hypothetical protein